MQGGANGSACYGVWFRGGNKIRLSGLDVTVRGPDTNGIVVTDGPDQRRAHRPLHGPLRHAGRLQPELPGRLRDHGRGHRQGHRDRPLPRVLVAAVGHQGPGQRDDRGRARPPQPRARHEGAGRQRLHDRVLQAGDGRLRERARRRVARRPRRRRRRLGHRLPGPRQPAARAGPAQPRVPRLPLGARDQDRGRQGRPHRPQRGGRGGRRHARRGALPRRRLRERDGHRGRAQPVHGDGAHLEAARACAPVDGGVAHLDERHRDPAERLPRHRPRDRAGVERRAAAR